MKVFPFTFDFLNCVYTNCFLFSFLLVIFLPQKHICIIHINMQRLLDTTFIDKKHFILRCTLSELEIFLLVFKFPKKIRFYDEQEITLRLKFHFLKNSSLELDIQMKAFTKVNVYEFLLKLTHTLSYPKQLPQGWNLSQLFHLWESVKVKIKVQTLSL